MAHLGLSAKDGLNRIAPGVNLEEDIFGVVCMVKAVEVAGRIYL